MVMSRNQNVGEYHISVSVNKFFENVAKFNYLERK